MKRIPDQGLDRPILASTLEAEPMAHLRDDSYEAAGRGRGTKRVRTDQGALEVTVPRDRNGNFQLQFAAKRKTRLPNQRPSLLQVPNPRRVRPHPRQPGSIVRSRSAT